MSSVLCVYVRENFSIYTRIKGDLVFYGCLDYLSTSCHVSYPNPEPRWPQSVGWGEQCDITITNDQTSLLSTATQQIWITGIPNPMMDPLNINGLDWCSRSRPQSVLCWDMVRQLGLAASQGQQQQQAVWCLHCLHTLAGSSRAQAGGTAPPPHLSHAI